MIKEPEGLVETNIGGLELEPIGTKTRSNVPVSV